MKCKEYRWKQLHPVCCTSLLPICHTLHLTLLHFKITVVVNTSLDLISKLPRHIQQAQRTEEVEFDILQLNLESPLALLCIMLKSSQAYFENLAVLKPPDFQSMFDRCSKLCMKGLNLLNLLAVLPRDVSLKIVDILQSLGNEISHVSETLTVRAIGENPISNPSPETEPNYLSRKSGWSRKEFTREQIQN